jgi:outer membrane protein OmpA-like peptidoglycan-associated protein
MMRLRTCAFFFYILGQSFLANSLRAQSVTLPKGYYIVVASYLSGQEKFAKKYSAELNKAGRHSSYGFDAARNYYYVYLDFYTDFSTSIDRMLNTRKEDGFGEAWVRIMKDGTERPVEVEVKNEVPRPPQAKIEEEITKPAEAKEVVELKEVVERKEVKEEAAPKVLVINEQTPATIVTEVVENPKADPVYIPQTLKNTQAFFSLYNAANGLVLDGEVEVIDTERATLLSKMKANSYLTLPDPKSKSGKLTLIGSAFGFRKIQHEMNYYNTEADTLQEDIDLIGNFYMVKFDLSRIVKGDIATLYNVYFYNDAAVMLPESKYELNKLLQMMTDSPSYRIMLHGHTNGKGRGKIIYVGPEKDFFNITKDDVVNESGSAKELSGARAQVIKDWLVAQGIDPNRIQTKAWGGGRMLHDKESQYARRNVRVEVEVLEN